MKQDRARRTYEELLDAAAAEFVRHGFAATNLSDIAARTRLTKGALYGHFASKADLADELTRGFEKEWAELLAASGWTLGKLTIGLARRMDDDPRFAAGLRLVTDAAWADRREAVPIGELRERLARLIGEAQSDGRIDTEHRPEALARLVLALLMGTHHTRWGTGGSVAQVREMWEVLLPEPGAAEL
ncbi:TetR family transcriptional regulator [Streptomyces sp. NPDC005538]|uniref:TetR family transcriptional regulator n=1 Tax=unclassified Streptomyces TaxID=2593676 RepID=UPI0033BB95C1